MSNENKKDFNAMMNNSKDMPKIKTITDEAVQISHAHLPQKFS